jgi:hypothetical protein
MSSSRRSLLALAVMLAGCSGDLLDAPARPSGAPPIGSGPPPGSPITPGPDGSFACTPGAMPSATPLRRLSMLQYRNTIRDLFADVPGIDASAAAAASLGRMPVDESGVLFTGMDTRLSDRHVQGFYDVSSAIAARLVADDTALSAIAGGCALDSGDRATCVDRLLGGLVTHAYRRPLHEEELARYRALDDGSRDTREVLRAIVFSVLMAPQFLYHTEVAGSAIGGSESHLTLDPYELASRISYHFWQSMPDAELLAAAADGALATESGYDDQVRRVFEDPRTRDTVASFYAEWFRLGSITTFDDSPAFDTFAEGTTIGEAGADHLAAAAAEISAMTDHFTWSVDGTFRDLLTTDLSFARSPHLAAIYGVETWDGTSAPPTLPAGERAGLLTRVAFLVTGTYTTHPIHRGAVVRRRILCDELAAPSPGDLPPGSLVPPPPDPTQTTRERFANKVINEPCATCHTQMNPIGYVLEQYDALGRFRLEERVLDATTGEEVNVLPIDPVAVPALSAGDDREMSSGVELSRAVAETGRVEACFARQYFRYTYRRDEDGNDGCALEGIRSALAGSPALGEGSLREALLAVALEPTFRQRRVE